MHSFIGYRQSGHGLGTSSLTFRDNHRMNSDPADTGQPIPAGLAAVSPNGHPPTPAQQTAAAASMIAGFLGQQLPQMLGQVMQAMPRAHVCGPCLVARLTWENKHHATLKAAIAQAAEAAGIPEGDPRAMQIDPSPFIPEHLRPGAGPEGLPGVQPAITTIQGTDVCAQHVPGAPGQAPGRTLLIAQGHLSPAMLTQLANS